MAAMTLRLPDGLLEGLRAAAGRDQRSLNSEVVWLLTRALEVERGAHQGARK